MKVFWFFTITLFIPIGVIGGLAFHIYEGLLTALLIIAGFTISLGLTKDDGSKEVISLIMIMLLIFAPIFVQNHYVNKKIVGVFEAAGGDCLSIQRFSSSVGEYNGSYRSAHAVMFLDDTQYYWSYKQSEFIKIRKGSRASGQAPNRSCYTNP